MTEAPAAHADTKALLIEAAERLFADQGVDRTSLRAITRQAGTNLASVHYHFGSKQSLVQAVLARRIAPLNKERLRRLELVPRDADGRPDLREVVAAFVAPPFEMIRTERGGHAFARFVLRAFSNPSADLRAMVMQQFEGAMRRFVDALTLALPHLPPDEIFWRFHFMVGSMAHTAAMGFLVHEHSGGICDPIDVEGVIDRLVAFLSAGLSAPAAVTGDPA